MQFKSVTEPLFCVPSAAFVWPRSSKDLFIHVKESIKICDCTIQIGCYHSQVFQLFEDLLCILLAT